MHEFNLRVGKAVLSLAFRHRRECTAFGKYFDRPSVPGPGDVQLSVRYRNDVRGLERIPDSLFLSKKGDGEGFSVADGLIEGRFSPGSGEGELVVQSMITEGNFARIFEQILYQAYWSAIRRKGIDAPLLHSCGIVRNGYGYAFTGKSGSGKSTVTGFADGGIVLNDEITVIELGYPRPVVSDTPFNGYFRGKREGSAELRGIMLLRQAPFHRITRTFSAEDVKTLSREIIPPMGLETPLSTGVYWEMLGYAERIRDSIPLYAMEFLPDPGFWHYIDERREEGRMEGKSRETQ